MSKGNTGNRVICQVDFVVMFRFRSNFDFAQHDVIPSEVKESVESICILSPSTNKKLQNVVF